MDAKLKACGGAWADPAEPPVSLCNTYMMWPESGSGCLASAAMTDHYSGVYEASTDSALSDQDVLACTEQLLSGPGGAAGEDGAFLDSQPPHAEHATQQQRSAPSLGQLSTGMAKLLEAQETIRNEMRREAETAPSPAYLKRHAFLSKELRETAVSWAIQVVDQFGVEQETLFLAVSYLDRFLSATQEVVHMDGLHLATLACLSLAAKQTEIAQPSTSEWAWLVQGNTWGTKEQLARMEWIVLDSMEWRGCTPTSWWFLHLFCYGLGTCPAPAICMAAYLLELSMLDAGGLSFQYSTLAGAALLLGHASVERQAAASGCALALEPLTGPMLQTLAPSLNLHQVQAATKYLAELHAAACILPEVQADAPISGPQLARAKYRADVWHNVGCWTAPVDACLAQARC